MWQGLTAEIFVDRPATKPSTKGSPDSTSYRMSLTDPVYWTDYLKRTLACYDEALLREAVGNLCRPRGRWPAADLIDRCLQAVVNPATIDRRLSGLDAAGRQALALIGHSRQPRWQVGHLVE